MSTENPQTAAASPFVPLLTTKDWNEEWKELQKARRSSDDSRIWDKKAETYNKPFGHSPYSKEFIKMSGIAPGDSVFDMGCGTGAIAIPLAMEGHQVCAADFSGGMLEHLEADAKAAGVADAIKVVKLAWEDDWEAHGVMPKSHDVAVASRSIATSDIKSSLMKLSSVARKKCAITISAGSSPRSDQQILSDIGLQSFIGRDFLYAFMILVEAGYLPKVNYIESVRRDSYTSEQDAYDSLKKMVLDASYIVSKDQIDAALEKLRTWVRDNLADNPEAGTTNERGEHEERFILKNPRKIIWAFISWDV